MKIFTLLIALAPTVLMAQFGFTRNDDISVIKNAIVQKHAWAGGLDYGQYSNIDLDLDGVQDVFIFDKSSNKPLTFIQKGANGQIDLEYAPQYEARFPYTSGWTLLVDYNGDGKKDVYSSAPGGARVYKNVSNSIDGLSFELVTEYLPCTYVINGININSFVNVGQGDLPAITDVDNDGDIDVLAFYFNSSCVRYYRNMSQELYGNSDSLQFKCSNVCYGNFSESNNDNTINLNTCCLNQVDNPEDVIDFRPNHQNNDRHAGSSVLSIDLDADGLQELLIGDISYTNLVRLQNDGTAPNTNANMVSPNYSFPSYDTPVDIDLFPAGFYVDVNNDGIRDLVVTPNLTYTSNNYSANWMYLNEGLDNNPDFSLQTEDFLQGAMIDGGAHSYPVFFDHNGDGLKDLIVSIGGRYDSVSTNNYSQLFYYENTGTVDVPEFTLMNEDYENLSGFDNRPHYFYRPAFGDADGDGDEDMLLADITDTMYYFENISSQGNVAQFNAAVPLRNTASQIIDEGAEVAPKFVDLDRDGKMDLVIGKRNGTLSYYKNVGGSNGYGFALVTANLGGVNVSEFWTNEGIAVPEFIDIDNEYKLICGARNGYLHYYDNIDGNLSGNFTLVDSSLEDIYTGSYSAPAVLDINSDNKFEMFVGNIRGGLSCFQSITITDVGLNDFKVSDNDISVYPNPANTNFYIDFSKLKMNSFQNANYILTDVSGRMVNNGEITKTKTNIDCANFTKGVYFLSVNIDGQLLSRKIVIN